MTHRPGFMDFVSRRICRPGPDDQKTNMPPPKHALSGIHFRASNESLSATLGTNWRWLSAG